MESSTSWLAAHVHASAALVVADCVAAATRPVEVEADHVVGRISGRHASKVCRHAVSRGAIF